MDEEVIRKLVWVLGIAILLVRRRPVEAGFAHIVDRNTRIVHATTSGRKEYGPRSLHLGPLGVIVNIHPFRFAGIFLWEALAVL